MISNYLPNIQPPTLCCLLAAGAIVACAVRPSDGAAAKRDGDRWAVLVGVDDYTLAAKLQFCAHSAGSQADRNFSVGFRVVCELE